MQSQLDLNGRKIEENVGIEDDFSALETLFYKMIGQRYRKSFIPLQSIIDFKVLKEREYQTFVERFDTFIKNEDNKIKTLKEREECYQTLFNDLKRETVLSFKDCLSLIQENEKTPITVIDDNDIEVKSGVSIYLPKSPLEYMLKQETQMAFISVINELIFLLKEWYIFDSFSEKHIISGVRPILKPFITEQTVLLSSFERCYSKLLLNYSLFFSHDETYGKKGMIEKYYIRGEKEENLKKRRQIDELLISNVRSYLLFIQDILYDERTTKILTKKNYKEITDDETSYLVKNTWFIIVAGILAICDSLETEEALMCR